ncbi:FK506-binding-like protein [Rhynchospora pubera]|uniref:FK506-binding-like protein n=1 Tax=Rhynchospora pubera TaxID=906938 RepID=A0AAV8F241_9POAL|nr:FK506-binding-like protein [Rhynchospora pubera]
MSEWKRTGRRHGNYRNERRGDQSYSWKHSQSHVSGTSSDLALEKEFCLYLSSITWGRLYYAQKYTYIYKNILQWDDSAALESFQAARSRFNAEYSGEPCDTPLPDPDMYIDQIDHDCVIDPELIADIEKELVLPEATKVWDTGTNGWDSVEYTDRVVPATGWESWGDSGDKDKEKDNSNNWDIYVDNKPVQDTGWGDNNWIDDPWERGHKPTGWGDNNISSSAWNRKEDSYNNGWDKAWDQKEDSNNNGWGNSWNDNSWYRRNEANSRISRKRDGNVGNGGFRERKVRYTGDGCQPGSNWRGSKGRNNRNYPYNIALS